MRQCAKAGLLPLVVKEVVRTLVKGRPLKEAYPPISEKIVPILKTKYMPLVSHLSEKYDSLTFEHRSNNTIWFCWLQGTDNMPEIVKVCLASQII